ncbi:MAG: heme-copper oxidase subunit III [Chitinophagaceae bacterium]|nr:heme-copper oxidase subunit III [Chitinophagaceae bacterium]
MSVQQKKIHPYKFNMWLAIAAMIMMFAGLTSAYIVKRSQPGWESFSLPSVFSYSTAIILVSSVTMQMALKAFKDHRMSRYRLYFAITAFLGVVFVVLQINGFYQFERLGMRMTGIGSNAANSFVLAIAGLHILHVLGGVIALLVIFLKAFGARKRSYDSIPVEVVSIYWHFVDILWVYIFIFFHLLH